MRGQDGDIPATENGEPRRNSADTYAWRYPSVTRATAEEPSPRLGLGVCFVIRGGPPHYRGISPRPGPTTRGGHDVHLLLMAQPGGRTSTSLVNVVKSASSCASPSSHRPFSPKDDLEIIEMMHRPRSFTRDRLAADFKTFRIFGRWWLTPYCLVLFQVRFMRVIRMLSPAHAGITRGTIRWLIGTPSRVLGLERLPSAREPRGDRVTSSPLIWISAHNILIVIISHFFFSNVFTSVHVTL